MIPNNNASTADRGSRALAIVALLALYGFYGWWILRTGFFAAGELYFTLVDDAMISMVYARNLAEGHGLVWSSGERIEGFSNLLWTLVMALLHGLEPAESRIATTVMFTSALVLLIYACLTWRLATVLCPENRAAPVAAAAITGLYFPIVFWTLRGLEVGFLCLLAGAATLQTLALMEGFSRRQAWSLALLLTAMLWTRLDTLIPAAILMGGLFLFSPPRDRWRSLAVTGSSVLAALGAVTAFRLAYFGQPLPNTYYLKLTGVSLVERLTVGWRSITGHALGDLWLPIVLTGIGLLFCSELRNRRVFLLLSLFAAQCFYSVYTGGDYAEHLVGGANRFVAQGAPFLFIVCVSVIERVVRRVNLGAFSGLPSALGSLALAALVLLPASADEYRVWSRNGAPMLDSDIWRARLGLLIRDSTAPDAVMACHAAGNIVYFSRRQAIDLLGKNDRHVAHGRPAGTFRPGHNKWDYPYSILELEPDLIADEWGESGLFLEQQEPKYQRLVNGVWVRADSRAIDPERLARPFR